MSDFFKGFNNRKSFLQSPRTFMTDKRTVCVKYIDGTIMEHTGITDPWRYITAIKKNVKVDDAWIKDE